MQTDNAVAWLLICAACVLAGCKTTEPPKSSVYDVLPGTWEWRRHSRFACDSNPHDISFSEDRAVMVVRYAKSSESGVDETRTVRYKILSDDPHLRVLREGETTRTGWDRLPVWDLVMLTPDRFCWRRVDKRPGTCTRPIDRCQSD